MKIRLWWRKRSIAAPRLAIRRQWSAPATAAVAGLAAAGVAAIAFGAYAVGRSHPDMRPAAAAQHAASGEPAALGGAHPPAATAESERSMEQSAQQHLAAQVKSLEAENSKLKEDLAFFESLLPANKTVSGIAISRLKADMAAPNQLRYRLVVMQAGKTDRDFTGTVQLAVTVLQNGKSAIISFPDNGAHDPADVDRFRLGFKRYQRLEGVLTLPDGTQMQSVQARVFEKGQLRAQQIAAVERNS